MAFIIGPMSRHLDGYKGLTENKAILQLDSDVVEISLNVGSHLGKCLVKKGDKVKIGTLLAERNDHFYVPIYSSVSGEVIDVKTKSATNHNQVEAVVIKNDYKDNKEEIEGIDLNSSNEQIVAFMKKIGLLGQGGAGFPTYIKYQANNIDTLIINAVECEPYITADVANISSNYDLFKLGVELMFKASNASKCYVCIKKIHGDVINELNKLFDNKDIVVKQLDDKYPFGWERTLVYEVLKKRYDKLPSEAGAIVSNASTAISLGFASKNHYVNGTKILTIAGDNINNPANVKCRIGTKACELIELCGGLNKENANLVFGGPMMGQSYDDDQISVTSITNAICVFEDKERVENKCLGCGSCLAHCPNGLAPALVNRCLQKSNTSMLNKLSVNDCIECGLCSYSCPSNIPLVEKMKEAKALLKGGK